MNTIGDTLGSWMNNMDDEERKIYADIKKGMAEVGLVWNQHVMIEFASITNTADRKKVMKNYLTRLNERIKSFACPRPDGWSI